MRGEDVDERVAAKLLERRPGELERDCRLRDDGELKDLAPTAIAYLGLTKPLQMSGQNVCI